MGGRQESGLKHTVITMCGSTKFKDEFEKWNRIMTLEGNLVISVGVFGHAEGIDLTMKQKEMLDEIHLQKIDIADAIFVVDVGGYIGSSTRREINYAQAQGKRVYYLTEFQAIEEEENHEPH